MCLTIIMNEHETTNPGDPLTTAAAPPTPDRRPPHGADGVRVHAPRPLVVASSSPRRVALLRAAGCEFDVVPPSVDEPALDDSSAAPSERAEALAYFKARSVAAFRPDAYVLGADTIVVLKGDVIGKPRDESHARQILASLSGSRHQVITGVALIYPRGKARRIMHAVTELSMRTMTATDIDDYIAGGEWVGKAGAYAIQESGDRFVTIEHGSHTNVVGLPMELVSSLCDVVQ